MFPAWPDSRRLQKIHPGHCHPGSRKVSTVALCANRKGPKWESGGLGGRRGGPGLGWPLPGARSPLFWSGWYTCEPGSRPGEPGPPFTSGGWAVPRTAAPRLLFLPVPPFLVPGSPAQFSSAWLPLLAVLILGVPPGSWQPNRPLPSFLPARAFSCLSRPFLPGSSKQTSRPAVRPRRPSSHPRVSAAVGVGSSAALPRGHGQPAAGDPPTLPSALHPLQAAASEKPLCLLLQSETLQCPRLAKWRWGNCRNPRVTSPSWLQTPVSSPEENSGRLPSGGQALGLLDAEVGTLT